MYKAKTRPTRVSFSTYLARIANAERRKDCKALAALMKRVTGSAPKIWGTGIVGFGTYHFKYDSGHEGDSPIVGFSSRKGDISVYLASGYAAKHRDLLSQLGRHEVAKACLYIRRLSEIQLPILERLVTGSVAETKRRR